jgi:hypothetical protein
MFILYVSSNPSAFQTLQLLSQVHCLQVSNSRGGQFEGDKNTSTGHKNPHVVYVLSDSKDAVQ